MTSLGKELVANADAIAHRWYEKWRKSSHPHEQVSEEALKDSLPLQLRIIGEQLDELPEAERLEDMWKVPGRLDPELRIEQEVPIEDIVLGYRLAVDTVREWIEEREIDVPFAEYSYFYSAVFELTAESVRRYAKHQTERTRSDRAEYLASVMHQIRTPVSVLAMTAELIARGGPEGIRAAAPKLRRQIRRVSVLVDSILRLERYEPGEIPMRLEEVQPADLIDEIMEDYGADARRKGLRFEAHVDRSLRMTLDPNLFVDALGNLVQNAVKYTTTGSVRVEACAQDDRVEFSVRDSGPGIPADRLRTLFRQTQPGSPGGAGLGLRVAQHAARAQHGRIDVKSEPGRGSTFRLCLPRVVPGRHARERDG